MLVQVTVPQRPELLSRTLRLGWLTLGWNVVEGVVAVAAAVAAGSIALLGFGVDSFVESASAGIIVWRVLAERGAKDHAHIERIEERARKLVAISLGLLAVYVTVEAVRALVAREEPSPSYVGIAITAISLVVMWWLARAKHRVAVALDSRAVAADAIQTDACFWLSLVVLVGIGLNAAFGWWWADPVAALGAVWFIGSEAKEAWEGEEDTCC